MNKIRQLREQHLLTQEELAALAGVAERTVRHAEAAGNVRLSTLRKLAGALRMEPQEMAQIHAESQSGTE
jgi:transcriptional regulator with XRE-family HTH domain